MNTKRIFLMMFVCFMLALVGCNNDKKTEEPTDVETNEEPTDVETTEKPTDDKTATVKETVTD